MIAIILILWLAINVAVVLLAMRIAANRERAGK